MTTPVTFTITSCNRLDLLKLTLDSFLNLNTYPIDEFIISDDSADHNVYEKIVDIVGPKFKIIRNESRLGLSKSLDNLFTLAKNEYIFHCEDDWFFEGNPNFISESLEILENFKNIHQVSIRHQSDNPHKITGKILKTKNNVRYSLLEQQFTTIPGQTWNGYSWNPGLRRKSDYLRMFPIGLSFFGDEYMCCDHTKKFNYLSANLEYTSCYHIGYNNRTKNFLI